MIHGFRLESSVRRSPGGHSDQPKSKSSDSWDPETAVRCSICNSKLEQQFSKLVWHIFRTKFEVSTSVRLRCCRQQRNINGYLRGYQATFGAFLNRPWSRTFEHGHMFFFSLFLMYSIGQENSWTCFEFLQESIKGGYWIASQCTAMW